MSETRFFRTETRPRREVRASRETENETRREIKQISICQGFLLATFSLCLSLSLSACLSLSLLSVFFCLSFSSLSLSVSLSPPCLSLSLSFFPVTACSIKNLRFEGIYLDLSLILLLVLLLTRIYYFSFLTRSYISHEKRERDEISLMVSFCSTYKKRDKQNRDRYPHPKFNRPNSKIILFRFYQHCYRKIYNVL
jgi:hypothetical protein